MQRHDVCTSPRPRSWETCLFWYASGMWVCLDKYITDENHGLSPLPTIQAGWKSWFTRCKLYSFLCSHDFTLFIPKDPQSITYTEVFIFHLWFTSYVHMPVYIHVTRLLRQTLVSSVFSSSCPLPVQCFDSTKCSSTIIMLSLVPLHFLVWMILFAPQLFQQAFLSLLSYPTSSSCY